MARSAVKPSAKATSAAESVEALGVKNNRGRDLLELRIRWKIVNETVEAGLAERKRLREAIEVLSSQMQEKKVEE